MKHKGKIGGLLVFNTIGIFELAALHDILTNLDLQTILVVGGVYLLLHFLKKYPVSLTEM